MPVVRYLAVSAALVGGLVWTGAAAALIVPQHSIAGVELNMTRPEVRAEKGDPDRIKHGTNDFGDFTEFTYRNDVGKKLRVTFQGNAGATAVFTNRQTRHHREGIHVGSTETQLHHAYPGAALPHRAFEFPPLLDRPFPARAPRDGLPDRDVHVEGEDHPRRLRHRLTGRSRSRVFDRGRARSRFGQRLDDGLVALLRSVAPGGTAGVALASPATQS